MWILIDTDNFFNSDDMMTSLLKKLSIFIKTGVIKRYGVCLVSFKIVDRIRRQSSSASCELCSHRRRRRDKTVSSRSFVASASEVCIGLYGQFVMGQRKFRKSVYNTKQLFFNNLISFCAAAKIMSVNTEISILFFWQTEQLSF